MTTGSPITVTFTVALICRGYFRQLRPYAKNVDAVIDKILGGESELLCSVLTTAAHY